MHRRSAADARLRSLCRAAYGRGRGARRFDESRGVAPALDRELLTLAGCLGHVLRRRCPAGLAMVAHSVGRLRQGICRRKPAGRVAQGGDATRGPGMDDFLSGESGTVGGRRLLLARALDVACEAGRAARGERLRLDRASRSEPPRRKVLALSVERPERHELAQAIRAELLRSRHEVELRTAAPAGLGKFQNLNALLGRTHDPAGGLDDPPRGAYDPPDGTPAAGYDWLLVVDDDVVLPRNFLDRLLLVCERLGFDLAQPAHARASHAAWRVTRRRRGCVARQTQFVEIGPVTAFSAKTFPTLLPFPDLQMGWGLDLHWAALAQEHGWRCGIVDALAVHHLAAPAASAYSRAQAKAEARSFLGGRPYLPAVEAQRTLTTYRRL